MNAVSLRPYQEEARLAIENEWNEGRRKTLLVLPTGCGKTIVFSMVAKDSVDAGKRVLILAHRGELLQQAADKLANATGLGCAVEKAEQTSLGSWFRVTVGSVQTLMRPKRLAKFAPDYFDTIVVDEAHHSVSDSYQTVLQHFPNAQVLGVTATADRSDKRNLGQYFDSIAYEYTLPRAIREGYLSPIKAQTIPLKLDLSSVHISNGDFALGDIDTALDPYLEQIADEMLAAGCMERKTVVFLPLVATSQKFAHILADKGFAAREVNGESKDRTEVLDWFDQAGPGSILCNSMLLTEGWDCPSVDCVIVLRPTKVRSLYCLDEKTEVLTKGGWKKDVAIGEDVLAFDPETQEAKYVPTIAKVRRKLNRDEFFCSIKGQSSDIRVTNNHRMLYDNKRRKGWKVKEAEYVADLKDGAYIPVAGFGQFKGVPLTDAELTFIGWVMTDGSINKLNNQITITQSTHQKSYCQEIEQCIVDCGMKYNTFIRPRTKQETHYNAHGDMKVWTISKGKPRGRDKDKRGWGYLEKWISKDLSPALFDMTVDQFETMLEAINHGDGHKNRWISYHIGKGNKTFIERLQIMAIQRGWRASISFEGMNEVRKCDLWKVHLKKQNYVKVGANLKKHAQWEKETHTDETCWCIQNELGTIFTRRNGKVAVVGNCQMVGRGTRLSPETGKTELLVLDFLWMTEKHDLCHPAHLIASDDEVAQAMTKAIEDSPGMVDLEEAEHKAQQDVVAQREESLAKELAAMRSRKRKLVDPLQFEMSIADADLVGYMPSFDWEMAPASDKQLKALEKFGIFPDEVECAGKASLLLDKLQKRRAEGYATPRQIRQLEGRGFQQVGRWSFADANKLISIIAANGWRTPDRFEPATYVPEGGLR